MKKNTFLILAAFALALATSSCSKSYNCHCVYTDNGTVTHTDDQKISETKQSKAKASCDEMDATNTATVGGTTSVTTTQCELN